MTTHGEQSALVTISDGISQLREVELLSIYPHPLAHNSFVADIEILELPKKVELRALSEKVYVETGSLVLFREVQPAAAPS